MKYQELVNVYEALGATTKRLEKTDILADFLKTVEEDDLEKITLMALGSVFPSWSEEEQGIGDKLVMKAVGDALVFLDAFEELVELLLILLRLVHFILIVRQNYATIHVIFHIPF